MKRKTFIFTGSVIYKYCKNIDHLLIHNKNVFSSKFSQSSNWFLTQFQLMTNKIRECSNAYRNV